MHIVVCVNNTMAEGNLENYPLAIEVSALIKNLNLLCLDFIRKNHVSIFKWKDSGKHNAAMHQKWEDKKERDPNKNKAIW